TAGVFWCLFKIQTCCIRLVTATCKTPHRESRAQSNSDRQNNRPPVEFPGLRREMIRQAVKYQDQNTHGQNLNGQLCCCNISSAEGIEPQGHAETSNRYHDDHGQPGL